MPEIEVASPIDGAKYVVGAIASAQCTEEAVRKMAESLAPGIAKAFENLA